MRATMREPILNKTSAFTADPHFRHIIGQKRSTFSIPDAMDQGHWVIVNLEKGRLGEQALSLGSLIFTVLKNALFTRETRSLYTVYCDEIQNLIAYGSGIETSLRPASSVSQSSQPISFSINIRLRCVPQSLQWALMCSSSFRAWMLLKSHRRLTAGNC